MNTPQKQSNNLWQAVALTKKLKKKPLRVLLDNTPIVLFRNSTGIQAIIDRCPHRFEKLSNGKIINDNIECPYHGWQFNGQGKCTTIPGLVEKVPNYQIKPFCVLEKDGVIFISQKPNDSPPYSYAISGGNYIIKHVMSTTQSTVIDAAENILDATHTHFVHKGLLRGLTNKRYLVRIEITGGRDWVEARYIGEDKQQGLISKLLEGERSDTIGRFRYPGIVELEYWGKDGINLVTAFHLRQTTVDTVEGIGLLVGAKQRGLGYLKSLFFKPLFHIALGQDKKVLKSTYINAKFTPTVKPIIGPLDFLRQDIERIMAGKLPKAAEKTQYYEIEL